MGFSTFFHISSSWVKIRWHSKNQIPRLSGSALKFKWWGGGGMVHLIILSLPTWFELELGWGWGWAVTMITKLFTSLNWLVWWRGCLHCPQFWIVLPVCTGHLNKSFTNQILPSSAQSDVSYNHSFLEMCSIFLRLFMVTNQNRFRDKNLN